MLADRRSFEPKQVETGRAARGLGGTFKFSCDRDLIAFRVDWVELAGRRTSRLMGGATVTPYAILGCGCTCWTPLAIPKCGKVVDDDFNGALKRLDWMEGIRDDSWPVATLDAAEFLMDDVKLLAPLIVPGVVSRTPASR